MTVPQAKAESRAWSGWKILLRIAVLLAVAASIGMLLRHLSGDLQRTHRPAGFVRGLLQGALMPCALPNLLVGNDVPIYALHNTGLTYKLGYTCGVDACGALFFGMFFWRLNRWRKRLSGAVRDRRERDSRGR